MNGTRRLSIVLLGLTCLAPTAAADPDYTPQIIPACKVFAVEGGGEVCGYDRLEDVKAVYEADSELVMRRAEVGLLNAKLGELNLQVGSLTAALAAHEGSRAALERRNVQLTETLLETDRKLQLERVKPRWGNPIAWTTAAVLGAVLIGVVGERVLD